MSGLAGRVFLRSVATLALAIPACAPLASAQVNPEASFQQYVQPIVFKNCNGCHTFGGHAGGLVMDSYATLAKGGNRGAAFVAGDPKNSLIVKAVHYGDAELQMPPRGKIGDADIQILESWIESLKTGVMPPVPTSTPLEKDPAKLAEAQPKPAAPVSVSAPTATPAPKAAVAAKPATVMVAAVKATPEQELFFENKIRPVLTRSCFGCHTKTASGGFRMDTQEAFLKGGFDGAAVVPGKPEESLLVQAVRYKSDRFQMPPTGKLKDEEIADIERWVKDGAPWPAKAMVTSTRKVTDADRQFWSFQKPVKAPVPTLTGANATWAANDIDRFILAKLEEKKLKPVGDADKRTLLRRVMFDLTGLPPMPAEVQAFLDDKSPNAYEKLVDKLLASTAYGERWGRKWLDLVRYADTNGSGGDYPIPQAYKYRDYVIRSFAEDKPYDRFIKEQIAGDLLPAKTDEERWTNYVATGYLAGTNRYEGKYTFVSDAVDNLGSAFLGVTIGCARCHDHKFDPIPTADYYSIYSILHSTKYPESGTDNVRFQRDFVFRDAKATEREDWKTFQKQLKPIQDAIEAVLRLPGTYDDLIPQLQARRMHLFEHYPEMGETAYAVTDGEGEDMRVQRYGDPKDLGEQVHRGTLQVLGGGALPDSVKGSGRLELANWLASSDNALTARVMVNRIWQGHFGKGIVATPNDFGTRGVAPSNQALLDYMAVKFMENGWSTRALHKEILMSHAYRLASTSVAANEEVDPENNYIWRHSRVRMDAEQLRDTLLADAQMLDRTPGAAHPFPPMHTWNWEDQNHFSPDVTQYETNKRTVYGFTQRTVRQTFFTLFDGPNTNLSTEIRTASLTPLQALYFMNGDLPKKSAAALTDYLLKNSQAEKANIEQAFQIVYSRPATAAETERVTGFLRSAADSYVTHGTAAAEAKRKAFEDFVKALFASNEFMYIE